MRFYTKEHRFYCGVDLHARSMYLCIPSNRGEVVLHRNLHTKPKRILKAIERTAMTLSFALNVCSAGAGLPISVPLKTYHLSLRLIIHESDPWGEGQK